MREFEVNPKVLGLVGAMVLSLVLVLSVANRLAFQVDAGETVVLQDLIDGELHVYTEPGMQMQWFGQITRYERSNQYWFSEDPKDGSEEDESIKVRFNDGGHAQLSGSVRMQIPTAHEKVINMHKKFGSQQAVEEELVGTIVRKAVYMTGPLMSSKESFADRRNELISFIEDQAYQGVYKTLVEEIKVKDPITGNEKSAAIVRIARDKDGNIQRQQISPIIEFGVILSNLSLTSIAYAGEVEKQIQQQQRALMEVQTAQAEARKAEQRALTVEKEGEAMAAEAKWKQEVSKATAVTKAQQQKEVAELNAAQKLSVARLDREAAAEVKQQQILLGQGEAARKKLVMQADGALEKKLAAWVEVQKIYGASLANMKQPLVPSVIMGGSGGRGGANGATVQDFMNMMMLKSAKDLNLDMQVK